MRRVALYTKPGCCLCDETKLVLERVRARYPFELLVRNIEEDANDFENYQYAIPVVTLDGREVARYRLDAAEFEAMLRQPTAEARE